MESEEKILEAMNKCEPIDDPIIARIVAKRTGSKFSPEVAERILDVLRKKGGRMAASRAAGVSHDTLIRWIERNPSFAHEVKKAEIDWKEDLKETCVQQLIRIGVEKNNPLTFFFLLKSYFPEIFGDRIRTEHAGFIESSETAADRKERFEKARQWLAAIQAAAKKEEPKPAVAA